MPKIHITAPDGATHELEIPAGTSRFGRAEDNDLVIPDGSVSSYHGEIALTDSGIHVHDRGSTNGTHVGGQRVEDADIAWGESFKLGNCDVVLLGDGSEAAASDEAPASYEEAPVEQEQESYTPAYEAPSSNDFAGYGGSMGAVITGLGSTPCPSGQRRGFGPKVKQKDSGGSLMMMLATLGLLACGAAAFMVFQMTA